MKKKEHCVCMWRGKGAFKGFLKRAETGARQEKNKPTFSSSATKKHVKAPVVTFPRRKEHRWSFSPPTLPLLKETLLAFERHSCLLPSSSSFSSSSFRSRLKREKPNIPPRAPSPASPLAFPFTSNTHDEAATSIYPRLRKKRRHQTQAPTGKGPPRPGREAFKPYTPGKGRETKKTFDTLPPFSSGSASRLHPTTARATKVGLAGTRGELVIQRRMGGGGLKEEEGEAHKQSDGGKGARL